MTNLWRKFKNLVLPKYKWPEIFDPEPGYEYTWYYPGLYSADGWEYVLSAANPDRPAAYALYKRKIDNTRVVHVTKVLGADGWQEIPDGRQNKTGGGSN